MTRAEVGYHPGACRQRAYFKSVTILVPQSWNLPDTEPSVGETLEAAEFRVAPGNPVYGNNPYTVQVGRRTEEWGISVIWRRRTGSVGSPGTSPTSPPGL